MARSAPTYSSTVAKQSLISKHLRDVIIEGKLAPGGRLPTQVQLVEQFRVSGVTIQRAMNRLGREGFIRTNGRSGTFVASHPPHLFNYGVVFHHRQTPDKHRSRYHDVLEAQLLQLQRSGDRRMTLYNGISGHEDTRASRQLLAKVRGHQMAGLLLIDGDVFSDTPLVSEKGIRRAAIMSCNTSSVGFPIVFPDMTGMIDLALDTLISRGRRRIATLITVPVYHHVGQYLRAAMQVRGISICERWMQIVPYDIPEPAHNNALLMMTCEEEKPEALFIVDDNLLDGSVSGLLAAGVAVGRQVEVIAHCNFPQSHIAAMPIHRVGFDTKQMVETAIGLIDLQRQGAPVPMTTKMNAVLQLSN